MNTIVDSTHYPLTKKWFPYISSFSFREKIPLQECIQESYILEWEVQNKDLENKEHRARYYRRCLSRRLETLLLTVYQQKDRYKSFLDANNPEHIIWRQRTHSISDLTNFVSNIRKDDSSTDTSDILDSFVSVRPFNEIYFEELVAHVTQILLDLDIVASQLFLKRIRLDMRWKDIRKKFYKAMPHNQFYTRVKLVKKIVQKEISHA